MKYQDAVTKQMTGRRSEKRTNRAVFKTARGLTEKGTWKELAAQMGISESTLRRARTGRPLSNNTRQKIEELKRRRDVRDAEFRPGARRNIDRAASNGGKLKMTGDQGPYGQQGGYRRRRTIEFELPAEVFAAMRDAYLEGDDARAAAILSDGIADYGWAPQWSPPGGWDVGDVEDLDVTGRH